MADEQLKAWLRQARADLDAGCSEGGDECHRRYWLQQASEKGIKALGLAMWNGPTADEGVFRTFFLHKHSPLKQLAAEVGKNRVLPKSLWLLLRQIDAELTGLRPFASARSTTRISVTAAVVCAASTSSPKTATRSTSSACRRRARRI